jgi:hypothetical protein
MYDGHHGVQAQPNATRRQPPPAQPPPSAISQFGRETPTERYLLARLGPQETLIEPDG